MSVGDGLDVVSGGAVSGGVVGTQTVFRAELHGVLAALSLPGITEVATDDCQAAAKGFWHMRDSGAFRQNLCDGNAGDLWQRLGAA